MKSFIIHDCFGMLTNSLMYGSQIQRGTPAYSQFVSRS